MSLEKHIDSLCKELQSTHSKEHGQGASPSFFVQSIQIFYRTGERATFFTAPITELPQENREETLLKVMKGNFMNEGTGHSIISISHDNLWFALNSSIENEVSEQLFREKIEEFVNFLQFWKEKITNG